MNPYYNVDYQIEDVEAVLCEIHDCIRTQNYTMARSQDKRKENNSFIFEFNLSKKKWEAILLGITARDFCHSLNKLKPGYEHEILYVFVPEVSLLNLQGEREKVAIYTKFNLIDTGKGKKAVVISFHRLNRRIEYLFRRGG